MIDNNIHVINVSFIRMDKIKSSLKNDKDYKYSYMRNYFGPFGDLYVISVVTIVSINKVTIIKSIHF
jgi:hypothetical protein